MTNRNTNELYTPSATELSYKIDSNVNRARTNSYGNRADPRSVCEDRKTNIDKTYVLK